MYQELGKKSVSSKQFRSYWNSYWIGQS